MQCGKTVPAKDYGSGRTIADAFHGDFAPLKRRYKNCAGDFSYQQISII